MTITNEWLKYQKYPEKSEILKLDLGTRAVS